MDRLVKLLRNLDNVDGENPKVESANRVNGRQGDVNDRRKFFRYGTNLAVRYDICGLLPRYREATLRDISKSGLRIECGEAFQEGEFVRLEIDVPGSAEPAAIFCRNVWAKKQSESAYSAGFSFINANTHEQETLLNYAFTHPDL